MSTDPTTMMFADPTAMSRAQIIATLSDLVSSMVESGSHHIARAALAEAASVEPHERVAHQIRVSELYDAVLHRLASVMSTEIGVIHEELANAVAFNANARDYVFTAADIDSQTDEMRAAARPLTTPTA